LYGVLQDLTFSRFGTIPTYDGRTNSTSIASRGKNAQKLSNLLSSLSEKPIIYFSGYFLEERGNAEYSLSKKKAVEADQGSSDSADQ